MRIWLAAMAQPPPVPPGETEPECHNNHSGPAVWEAAAVRILKRRIRNTAPRGLKSSSCARKGALSPGPQRRPPHSLPACEPASNLPYFTDGGVACARVCVHEAHFSHIEGNNDAAGHLQHDCARGPPHPLIVKGPRSSARAVNSKN